MRSLFVLEVCGYDFFMYLSNMVIQRAKMESERMIFSSDLILCSHSIVDLNAGVSMAVCISCCSVGVSERISVSISSMGCAVL